MVSSCCSTAAVRAVHWNSLTVVLCVAQMFDLALQKHATTENTGDFIHETDFSVLKQVIVRDDRVAVVAIALNLSSIQLSPI